MNLPIPPDDELMIQETVLKICRLCKSVDDNLCYLGIAVTRVYTIICLELEMHPEEFRKGMDLMCEDYWKTWRREYGSE